MTATPQEAADLLARGELARLAAAAVPHQVQPGEVELEIYYCPRCRDAAPVVLGATTLSKGKRASRRPLGRWVYPGTVWPRLTSLFPRWQPEQTAPTRHDAGQEPDQGRSAPPL